MVQCWVSHVMTTDTFANSKIIQRLSILQVKDPIQSLSWRKSNRASELYQSCAFRFSFNQFAEFAESSCFKWQTVDTARVGQVATHIYIHYSIGEEGVRPVVLVLNQQDALQPHHAPALMSGKAIKLKSTISASLRWIFMCVGKWIPFFT